MEYDNPDVSETSQTSNYSDLYKYNGLQNNQLARRDKLLLELKQRRNDQVDELRGITDIFEDDKYIEEPLNAVGYRKQTQKNYGHKIMLSEWMIEKPPDLEDNWLIKICPVGIRNIIVAHNGVTRAYNRRNKVKASFTSNLPGGGPISKAHSFTLLDTIYRSQEKTYYILDVLVWNSCSLLKCSSEFRFFFLKSKFLEDPDFSSSKNKTKFVNIDYHMAALNTIECLFTNMHSIDDVELPVDGVLFYHKDAIYTPGPTPLVGWLKPYMLPEKLAVPVHESYILKKPKNYESLEKYLNDIQIKYSKKNRKKNGAEGSEHMDEEISEETDIMDM